jgi:hypothetical protein
MGQGDAGGLRLVTLVWRSPYVVPKPPEAGWSAAPSRRRLWVSRLILLGILLFQALLSLRLHNTAFEDEALYLYAGHAELGHLLHGTDVSRYAFNSYFSGSPYLYPVVAALADSLGGLAGARALSLVFMLAATGLLYSFTRRLFNERAGLCAAGVFAVCQSTQMLGYFATYDAAAIFLLALAAWLVVRAARTAIWPALLAVPVTALAIAVKYASALYLPVIVCLAVLAAWPHRRAWRALGRGAALALGSGALGFAGLEALGAVAALRQTTTGRAQQNDAALSLLRLSAEWGGPLLAVAVFGTVMYVWRGRLGEMPGAEQEGLPGRLWRVLLGTLLCTTALLAPLYQMHLHTGVSLHKHVGYGLLFAAPMAGVGITRLVGAHFRYPQLGIMAFVGLMVIGITQANQNYGIWPDATSMLEVVRHNLSPDGKYLAETSEVPVYYLDDRTSPGQWTNLFYLNYARNGRQLTGQAAYSAAINDGYFDLIVLDGITAPLVSSPLRRQLRADPLYRLIARLPFHTTSGSGAYEIWSRQGPESQITAEPPTQIGATKKKPGTPLYGIPRRVGNSPPSPRPTHARRVTSHG